jgi:hypothetical protein
MVTGAPNVPESKGAFTSPAMFVVLDGSGGVVILHHAISSAGRCAYHSMWSIARHT